MKILIYTDPHFSQNSSIIRTRGNTYSTRLENEIRSINWVEQLAMTESCDSIFCLGDFFDSPALNAEELTALQDINWSNISHSFLVGNHEMGLSTLFYSSAHVFKLCPRAAVFDTPVAYDFGDFELCMLPYILESDRQTITDYFGEKTSKKRIILSHNDLQGIQMGNFISKEGFSLADIKSSCDLFINGHLHNGGWIDKERQILNLGNLTGQNFSENGFIYQHQAIVLNTDNMSIHVFKNPYAFNFYKIDATDDIKQLTNKVTQLENAVITIKINEADINLVKAILSSATNIIESRILIEPVARVATQCAEESIKLDHIQQFKDYIYKTIGVTDIIDEELAEISK